MRRAAVACGVILLALAVPVGAQAQSGTHVYIPRIGLVRAVGECPIVDRVHDTTALGDGVCWLEGTATLGHDWARMVLAGHSNGAFEQLALLEQGDQVIVWDAHTVEVYTITDMQVVSVDDTRWLMPTTDKTLTLITCAGDNRLIVNAALER